MTTTLTEKDKKLLVFLAFFVIVVGLGAGVILPLLDQNQRMDEQLMEAEMLKMDMERKVAAVPGLEKAKMEAEETFSATKEEFSDVVPSREIDKMITEEALANGVTITNMRITMPAKGSYAELTDYTKMLNTRLNGETEEAEEKEGAYTGFYISKVDLTMSGNREALQKVLDKYAASEPKLRITDFLWESGKRDNSGRYTLSVKMEVYMMEDAGQSGK